MVDFDKGTNVMEILASNGDTYLGGADIDNAIAKYLTDKFMEENGVDLTKDPMAMQRIVEAAEKAKIELSSTTLTEINLPYISVKDTTPLHFNMNMNKATFEEIVKPYIERVVDSARKAVNAAKVDKLDGIILVGGSCRIPSVQKALEKEFSTKLIHKADLDLAVAEGASIQANILAGNTEDTDVLLLDVTPLTLGIETMGGVMTPIIEANTTIPTKKSQVFSTATDNQSAVDINVLQGARKMAKDNKSIGLFRLDGIMPARRGVPQIEVTFDIDANGIVSVKAMDKATQKEQHITIQNQSSLSKDEIEKIKADATAHEAEDKKLSENIDKSNKAQTLVFSCEDALKKLGDKISDDDKNKVQPKIDELKKAIDGKDYDRIDGLVKSLNESFQPIAQKLYESSNNGNRQTDSSTSSEKNDSSAGKEEEK